LEEMQSHAVDFIKGIKDGFKDNTILSVFFSPPKSNAINLINDYIDMRDEKKIGEIVSSIDDLLKPSIWHLLPGCSVDSGNLKEVKRILLGFNAYFKGNFSLAAHYFLTTEQHLYLGLVQVDLHQYVSAIETF